jgi:hypothetical protein
LADLSTFLANLMVYGSATDVAITEKYVPAEEFRRVLENAPAGMFTAEVWRKWHQRSACRCNLFRGAGFRMAHWVPNRVSFLVGTAGPVARGQNTDRLLFPSTA